MNAFYDTFRHAHRLTAGILAVLAATASAQAAPATSKTDLPTGRAISAHRSSGTAPVIVNLAGPLTAFQQAQLAALGARHMRPLAIIHSIALRLPTRSLSKLVALPFVAHVSSDGTVTKCDAFTYAGSGAGVAYQQYGLDGTGVGVAVLDTGVHFDNDFAQTTQGGPARIAANRVYGTTNTDDFCGHGTHVAGIIAGNGAASSGSQCFSHIYGIARAASVINVKVLGDRGEGNVSDVISGLQWTIANRNQYHIRVINLSLGHPVGESYTTDPLCQAVEAAWKAGIVVVCAAGNEGRASTTNNPSAANEGWGTNYGSIQSPGNDPYVITVGATKSMDGSRAHDRIATYSSRGPSRLDLVLKPDIIAPGNKVVSTNTNNSYLAKNFGATNEIPYSSYTTQNAGHLSQDYFCLSGTSMASPVVAGAAALMLQASPSLTPDTVKARLMLSADKWADPSGSADPLTYGAGYLNIPAALLCSATASLPALSPTLVANSDGSLSLVMDRAAWGSTVLSGTRAAWGCGLWGTGITDLRAAWGSSFTTSGAFPFSSAATADRAAWGSNSLASSRAAWGSSVWNDRAAWGCSTGAVDLTSTVIYGE